MSQVTLLTSQNSPGRHVSSVSNRLRPPAPLSPLTLAMAAGRADHAGIGAPAGGAVTGPLRALLHVDEVGAIGVADLQEVAVAARRVGRALGGHAALEAQARIAQGGGGAGIDGVVARVLLVAALQGGALTLELCPAQRAALT